MGAAFPAPTPSTCQGCDAVVAPGDQYAASKCKASRCSAARPATPPRRREQEAGSEGAVANTTEAAWLRDPLLFELCTKLAG
jgi:hypothetical protein